MKNAPEDDDSKSSLQTLKYLHWLRAIGRSESQIGKHIRAIARRDSDDIQVERRRDDLNGALATVFRLRGQMTLDVDDLLSEILDLLPSDTLHLIQHARARRDDSNDTSYLNIAWSSAPNGRPLFGWTVKLRLRPHRGEKLSSSISESLHAQTEADAHARAAQRLSAIRGVHPEDAEDLVRLASRSALTATIDDGVVNVRIYEDVPWWIRANTAAVAIPQAFWDYVRRRD